MEVFQFQNNYLQRKQEDQYLVQNAILILKSFHWLHAINFLMPYFFLSYYTVLRYRVLLIEPMLRKPSFMVSFHEIMENFTVALEFL